MHIVGVLDYDDVLALGAGESQFLDGAGAVGEQALAVLVIDPGLGHDLGTVHGADIVDEAVDEAVEHLGLDQAALGQQ